VARKTAKVPKEGTGSQDAKRHGTLIRIADDVARDAKLLSSFLNISMAEFVSATLRPIIKTALEDQMRKRLAASESSIEGLNSDSEVN